MKKMLFDKTFRSTLLRSIFVALLITLVVGLISRSPLFSIVHPDFANAFLATIAQVLGGTTAILFTVSALAITIAADRYTLQLLSRFISDPLTVTSFAVITLCTLVAIISIGVDLPMYQIAYLAMVFFIGFSFLLLIHYLFHTLVILKPEILAKQLCEEGIVALNSEDTEQISRILSALGDIVLKAVARQEEEIAQIYLESLKHLQIAWNEQPTRLVQGNSDRVLAIFQSELRSPVFNQFKRIFQVLLINKDENLARFVEDLLSECIDDLFLKGDQRLTLTGLLSQYREFAHLAIKHQNLSRFGFIHSHRYFIRRSTSITEFTKLSITSFRELCLDILKQDDTELWDHTLYFFCSGHESITSLYESLQRYELGQLYSVLSQHETITGWDWLFHWEEWGCRVLKPRLTPQKRELFDMTLNGLTKRFSEDTHVQEKTQLIKRTIDELEIATQLVDTFFRIAFKALSLGKLDYIKALWRSHDSTPYLDRVPADIGYILSQINFYVEIGSRFSFDPDEELFIARYSFLHFSYALFKAKSKDWTPDIPPFDTISLHRYGRFSGLLTVEVKSTYELLTNLFRRLAPVKEQFTFVSEHAPDWDDMFDGDAMAAFTNAHKWLTEATRQNTWREEANKLLLSLPLDKRQVAKYYNRAQISYRDSTRVSQLTTVINPSNNNAATQKLRITPHADKIDFTVLDKFSHSARGLNAAYVGSEFANQEVTYILQVIQSDSRVVSNAMQYLNFAEIAEIARSINDLGHKPTVLVTSTKRIHQAFRNDRTFASNVGSRGSERFLIINDSIHLQILELPIEDTQALIMSPTSGRWHTIEQFKSSLSICPKNPLKVHLNGEGTASYQLVHPEAVAVLRFDPGRSLDNERITAI